jgi:hypothetical protein
MKAVAVLLFLILLTLGLIARELREIKGILSEGMTRHEDE